MSAGVSRFLKELRRRRVFRVAGLYVVGVWLVMQVADVVFPAWGIPDAAVRYLLWAGLLGFPVALTFGWMFDVTRAGIRRTQPVSSAAELQHALPLRRADYLILSAFLLVAGAIAYDTTGRVMDTATPEEWRPATAKVVENSVAVLPFANLSGDSEHEYFADGISEEILNRLAGFKELQVIARTSSFAFKDSGYDIARISALLGVKYLLQGSVRRDGQQLRIAAQLVDQSGVQVWSNTFDRQLGAIFALQDEIAEAVATSIVPQIVAQPAMERLPDLEAYEAYLSGREILARREPHAGDRALAYFDRAIERDPEFAEPYAERAVARLLQFGFDDDFSALLDRVQRDIDRALQLKPDLARAYAAQALLMDNRDPGGGLAEREAVLRKSLALDPNQVDAWNWLHSALKGQGREDEAEQALERALRLDPLAPSINANMAAREAARGEVVEAEQRLLRVLEAPWAPFPVYVALIGHYIGSGRFIETYEMVKRYILETISSTGRPPELFGFIAINAMLGRQEQAAYWRDRNREVHPDNTWMRAIELSILSTESGLLDHAEALTQAEDLIDSGNFDLARAPPDVVAIFGEWLALSGDHEAATRVLEPLVAAAPAGMGVGSRARQALAWTYLQTDDFPKAALLLESLDRDYREAHAAGDLRRFNFQAGYNTGGLAGYAMTTLLAGNKDAALDLLDEAVEVGWRGYYGIRRDPRWDAVREHPRFRAILAKAKADIDLQRARLEAMDAEDDFIARFDALLAGYN
jgi:TolB-like protein/tetratricopeptide (TPR) repeat protein